jgi:predicted RecA/RadA family phage recombinase
MSTKYVNNGMQVEVTLDATYAAGDGFLLTDRAGILQGGGASGDVDQAALEGTYTVTKDSAVATTVGQKAYYHATNKATTSSSSAKALGWFMETTATGSTSAKVKLGGF